MQLYDELNINPIDYITYIGSESIWQIYNSYVEKSYYI